jgi:hypothetical protein
MRSLNLFFYLVNKIVTIKNILILFLLIYLLATLQIPKEYIATQSEIYTGAIAKISYQIFIMYFSLYLFKNTQKLRLIETVKTRRLFFFLSLFCFLIAVYTKDNFFLLKLTLVTIGISLSILNILIIGLIYKNIYFKLINISSSISELEREILLDQNQKIVKFSLEQYEEKWKKALYNTTDHLFRSGLLFFDKDEKVFFDALYQVGIWKKELQCLLTLNKKFYNIHTNEVKQNIIKGRHDLEKLLNEFKEKYGYRPTLPNFKPESPS